MIGFLSGKVIFSDGQELILLIPSGIGHQIYFSKIFPEGHHCSIYISHIYKESGQELYGFSTLKEKKTFELLLTVKGVGPKSAFSLLSALSVNEIIRAVEWEDKKTLCRAQGIGNKAAAQILLDLNPKIKKVQMYSDKEMKGSLMLATEPNGQIGLKEEAQSFSVIDTSILQDTLLACRELGFKDDVVAPLAQKLLNLNHIVKTEQLVHLVLKEL